MKTFPPIAPPAPPPPAAIDPTAEGFGVCGPHLLSPILDGPDGSRVSPCPVCRVAPVVSRSAGGWVPLRCATCGTEFVATDGSAPPPPPKTDVPEEVTEVRPAETVWMTAEPPVRFELTSPILTRADGRRASRCPVCAVEVAVPTTPAERVRAWCPFCGTEFVAINTPAAKPTPKPAPPRLPRSFEVHTLPSGFRYALCPACRTSRVTIPKLAAGVVRLRCSACGADFVAVAPEPAPPRPMPTPPTPQLRFWDTVRLLAGLASPVLIVLVWVLLDRLVKSIGR